MTIHKGVKANPSAHRTGRCTPFLAIPLSFALASSATAATKTWNTTTGSLSASGSWSATGTPVTTDETLFDGTVTPAASINTAAGTNLSFGNLIWNNNSSSVLQMNTIGVTSTQLRLSGGGGSTAAIAAGGAAGDLLVMGTNATNNTLTISDVNPLGGVSLRLRLDASGNFNVVNSGATLSIQTILSQSGTQSLTKTGAGTLLLGSANSYTGGTTLTAGTLALGSSSALSSGSLTINGGRLASSVSARTLTNVVTVGGNFTLGGLSNSITLNGTMDLGGTTRTITLDNSATIGGTISNGGLTLSSSTSARTLTLNSSHTYFGATLVTSGTLLVNGALANSSSVSVSSQGTIGGNGSIANSLTVDGGAFLQPGNTPAAVGSLATGSLTVNGTYLATLTANGVNDFLNITGTANFAGTIAPVLFGYAPVANDAFNLADWTGTFSGTPSFDYSGATLDEGLAWDSSSFASDGTLRVVAIPEPANALLASLGLLALLRRRI
jgi:autotransporter-associated beta strand protein